MSEKSFYVCQSCAWEGSKWHGRCPQCQSWNSIVEEFKPITEEGKRHHIQIPGGDTRPLPFSKIQAQSLKNFSSGIKELNRVLGGGLVPGAFYVVGRISWCG